MIRRLRNGLKGGIYSLCIVLLMLLARGVFRLRVRGREHLSRGERYIAVARHRSYWDIPFLAVAVGWRNRVHFIARKGLMKEMVLIRPFLRAYTTMIDRENFGKSDFRKMLEAIRRERLVAIFPEGTTRRQADAKAGAIHFAALTDRALLPVDIRADGPYPPRYPFGFPRVTVAIGRPVTIDELNGDGDPSGSRSERYRRMSERLMERVDNAGRIAHD